MKKRSLFLKLFIHINSFLWIIFLYVLNNQLYLVDMSAPLNINENIFELDKYKDIINIIVYLSIIYIVSLISIYYLKNFDKNTKESTIKIRKIIPIYREYMPVFLSIIIIALSLKGISADTNIFLYSIFFLLFIFFYMTKIGFLNPFYYIFGIRVYKVETDKSEYILISNEKDYKFLSEAVELKKIDEELLIYLKDKND